MLRLVLVEARRAWGRRSTWGMLALGLAFLSLALLTAYDTGDSGSQAATTVVTSRAEYDRMVEECRAAQAAGEDTWDPEVSCESQLGPAPGSAQAREAEAEAARRLSAEQARTDSVRIRDLLADALLPLLLIPLATGASGVGSEYASGALGQWLTFVPQRGRVYASRLLGPVVALALPLLGLIALVVAAISLGLATGGGSRILAATHWQGVAWVGLRGWAAMLAVLVGSAALGFITRHTAAAIATVLGWFVVVEGFAFSASGRDLGQLSLANHMIAWVKGRQQWMHYPSECRDGPCLPASHVIHWPVAGWHLLLVLAALVALGGLLFRRRDLA